MKKTRHYGLFASAVVAFTLLACQDVENRPEAENGEPDIRMAPGANGINGQFIVVLKENKEAQTAEARAAYVNGVVAKAQKITGTDVLRTYSSALNGFAINADGKQIREIAQLAEFKYAEQDQTVSLNLPESSRAVGSWGLDRIDQRDLPLNDTYDVAQSGRGVSAYVLDTGISPSHNDFGGRVGTGYNAVNDNNGTDDCHGHGTHVSGTVGGENFGVAKGVTLYPVRVLNCEGGEAWSTIVEGVDWLADNAKKPAVANISIGGGYSQALNDAVDAAVRKGIFITASAGNANQDACNESPSAAPSSISVGATTNRDARASFSNWGSDCVDIMAPGDNIVSASYQNDNGSSTMSGTSMAAPHVAGAGALFLQNNPNATPDEVFRHLESKATTGHLSGLNGSPDLLLFVQSEDGDDDDDEENNAPVAAFSFKVDANNNFMVFFTNESSDADGDAMTYRWDFGDGVGSAQESPRHTYKETGSFTVKLTATDSNGASDSVEKAVRITDDDDDEENNAPVAAFSFKADANNNFMVFFTNESSDPDGDNMTFRWDFGDGTGSAQESPRHTYKEVGSFTVKLTATDSNGARDSVEKVVRIEDIGSD